MIIVLLLFAFVMSLIIEFAEKIISPNKRHRAMPKEEPIKEKVPGNPG